MTTSAKDFSKQLETNSTNKSQVEDKKVNHCRKCNTLYYSSIANVHSNICGKCTQSNFEFGPKTDRLKSGLIIRNAVAGCVMCKEYFKSGDAYSVHMLGKHKTGKIDDSKPDTRDFVKHCSTCNCLFLSKEILDCHQDFCSDISYSDFDPESNQDILKAASELKEAVAICLSCNSILKDDTDLMEHMMSHKEKGDSVEIKVAKNGCESVSDPEVSNEGEENVMDDSESADDETITNLRSNFSKLLRLLISDDPELMEQLGYEKNLVDDVLISVLQQMGQEPIPKDKNTSDLENLRKNIQVLLDFCLKDQILTMIGDGKKSTDEIVIEALKMFSTTDL